MAYNQEHGITPRSAQRTVEAGLSSQPQGREAAAAVLHESVEQFDYADTLRDLEGEMLAASEALEFEKAALLRDQIRELKARAGGGEVKDPAMARMERQAARARKASGAGGRRRR